MPLYEYRCQSCGNQFTMRRAIDERDAALACANCSSEQVARLITMPAVFSVGDGAEAHSLGTSSCAGCAQTSCGACGVSHAS